MKLLIAVCMLACASFFSGRASAQSDCIFGYVTDSQGGFCGSCTTGYPPGFTVSHFAQRKKFYVICQSCGIPCQILPSSSRTALACAAANPESSHLEGALLMGLLEPSKATGFGKLMQSAPEIALVLASYGLDGGKAPQLDMRWQQSFFDIAPSAQLARQLLQGVEPGPETMAASGNTLPAGTTMRVDARTELLEGGGGHITLTSSLFRSDSQKTASILHEYSVSLAEVPGEKVDVLQYVKHRASVYRIVSIEKML